MNPVFVAAAALALAAGPALAVAEQPDPVRVAVLDFDYLDTSGLAPAAATGPGAAGLDRIRAGLEEALEGLVILVELPCAAHDCRASNTDADVLVAEARTAGADLLVYGAVHKVSVLIQNLQVEALAVADREVVVRRQFSFRGESDEAFERAGRFAGKTIAAELQD